MPWLVVSGDAVTVAWSDLAPDGGVAVTKEQALEIEAARRDGRTVTLVDGAPVIGPAPPPPPPPDPREAMSASPAAIRLALLQIGRLDEVEAIVDGNRAAAIEWQHRLNMRRTNKIVVDLGTAAGWTPSEIDAVFTLAMSIDAASRG